MQEASWKKYIDKKKGAPPRELLIEALNHVPGRTIAVDLGAGPLNDSIYLLEQGFEHVIAVDYDDAAEECAKDFLDEKCFSFVKSRFENFKFPPEVDLINAAYALPFVERHVLEEVLKNIKESLKKGAVFCGQFFGDRDEWNVPDAKSTFFIRQEVERLFANMEMLKFFEEEEKNGQTAFGDPKHWHVFHVIVRK